MVESRQKKSLLVCGAVLAGLSLSMIVGQSKAVHAASNNQVVLVSGQKGSAISDNNQFTTSTWSALERGQRALDDPALVGQSLNTKQSLDGLKQDAVKSIKAYADKGNQYLDAQNLNDSEKAALKKQNADVVTATSVNIDQAHSVKGVLSALKAGAYGILIDSSSTTVNQAKDNNDAQNQASQSAGSQSKDNGQAQKSASGDLNNASSSDSSKVDQLAQEIQDLGNNLKAQEDGRNSSNLNPSNNSKSNNGNLNANKNGSFSSNTKAVTPTGKVYHSPQDLYAAIMSGDDVNGAQAVVHVVSLRKLSNGHYTFNDNSMQFVADDDVKVPIKNGDTVTITVDRVATNDPLLSDTKDWFRYGVFFSNLQLGGQLNDGSQTNASNAGNGSGVTNGGSSSNNAAPSSGNNGGSSSLNGTSTPVGSQIGTRRDKANTPSSGNNGNNQGNAQSQNSNGQVASQTPTASSLPQTSANSNGNRGLVALGLSLISMLVLPIRRLIKNDK